MLYVVERLSWRVLNSEETTADDFGPDTRPHPEEPPVRERITYQRDDDEGGTPVRAFHDRDAAEAFARALDMAQREQTNPFRYGWTMNARTSLDEPRFRDWLLDAELTPPGHDGEEDAERLRTTWADWWLKASSRLNDEHLTLLGRAMNNALEGRNGWDPSGVPVDVLTLEKYYLDITQLTVAQREAVRMGLIYVVIKRFGFPDRTGERDESVIEAKWRDWWDANRSHMTAYQRHLVWQGLDKVTFYRVIALTE